MFMNSLHEKVSGQRTKSKTQEERKRKKNPSAYPNDAPAVLPEKKRNKMLKN